jgi:aryl-alcohol dehydrogenase-like predicted oxidoreductase
MRFACHPRLHARHCRFHSALSKLAHGLNIRIGELSVNAGFGAMRVANIWGPAEDRASARAAAPRKPAYNFFDTAGQLRSAWTRELIAEALHPYPKGLVIATKGGLLRPRPGAWDPDGRPEHLKRALDGSLKRLKLDRIDLYQLHAPDPQVPFADSVGALADGQRAGKIRHVGVSNVSVKQLEEARRICTIVSVQNEYNLVNRSSESVLNACERLGIAFLPWYPLGSGEVIKNDKVKAVARKHRATGAVVAGLAARFQVAGHAVIPHRRTSSTSKKTPRRLT